MQFIVSQELFNRFPNACFGVVIAQHIPSLEDSGVKERLVRAVSQVAAAFPEGVRGHRHVNVWREAFTALGCNPNKFLSSVEALTSRVYKTGQLPSINGIVDLVNSFSLQYVLPMGAHDLDSLTDNMELRFTCDGDYFIPFGEQEREEVPPGEVVYACGAQVRTRRWVWRQSEYGKITHSTANVFFPIDGFKGVTDEAARNARDELAALLSQAGAKVIVGWVDAENRTFSW